MLNLKKFGSSLIALLIFSAGLNVSVHAQNPDITVKLENGTAFGGGTVVRTAKLDNQQTSGIQGWSLGICNDENHLTPLGTAMGADALLVKNGAAPDFDTINTTSDSVTQGVVICF
ncbi:MAG: hypothetical protein GWP35_00735 [Proteobacteria bacterium]|nr:hypothetical protein [Pseudomonadota bacterium]